MRNPFDHSLLGHAMRLLLVAFVLPLFLVGCSDSSRSGYMQTTVQIFNFNPRLATARFEMTLAILKRPPPGSKLTVTLENPAGGNAIALQTDIPAGHTKVSVESEPLLCIRKDRRYAVKAELSDAQGKLLQTIDSGITSSLDQDILPSAPLVEGPGYDLNKSAEEDSAGTQLRAKAAACPK